MWSGTMRSIANCSSGRSSIATSVLVFVLEVPSRGAWRVPIADRRVDPGHRAIDVQHAGGYSEEEQDDDAPRPRAEPMVDRPTQRRRDINRGHQLQTDAEAKADILLQDPAIADRRFLPNLLRPRLVDPLAEPRQRIRRVAFAHLREHRIAAERGAP